jgi:hypothetical protein
LVNQLGTSDPDRVALYALSRLKHLYILDEEKKLRGGGGASVDTGHGGRVVGVNDDLKGCVVWAIEQGETETLQDREQLTQVGGLL